MKRFWLEHPRCARFARWLERFLALVGLGFLVFHAGFEVQLMVSPSMSPTLQSDPGSPDRVLVERVSYWFREPRRWEVVNFLDEDAMPVSKRAVAFPGETITLANRRVVIDGREQTPPRGAPGLVYVAYGNLATGRSVTVTNGIYVLGDNSRDSSDSRFTGPVPATAIRGRVWLRLWPWSRLGFIR